MTIQGEEAIINFEFKVMQYADGSGYAIVLNGEVYEEYDTIKEAMERLFELKQIFNENGFFEKGETECNQ
jgi:hypothetical protein